MNVKKILAAFAVAFFLFSTAALAANAPQPPKKAPKPEEADKKWNAGNLELINLIKAKKYDEALKKATSLQDYLAKNKLAGGQEDATTYNNLGMIYLLKGNFDKANACLTKALKMRDAIFGPTSLESATVWLNLSHLYKQQAQYIMNLHGKSTDSKDKKPQKK